MAQNGHASSSAECLLSGPKAGAKRASRDVCRATRMTGGSGICLARQFLTVAECALEPIIDLRYGLPRYFAG
jgi:hypothetical protein